MKEKSQLERLTENNFLKPGIINNGIIKLYGFAKKYDFSTPVDWFIQAYIGGELKRKDQEKFAEIANIEPYKLSLKNEILMHALSIQYYPMGVGAGKAISAITGVDIDSNTAGWTAVSIMNVANIIRGGIVYKTKKAFAGLTINSLILNSTSYAKDLKEYLKNRKN